MIVQITITRDESFLLKEMLPVWQKYADGFVFLVDSETTDNTRELLENNKQKYNILEIIEFDKHKVNPKEMEGIVRQTVFDAARKYTNKIRQDNKVQNNTRRYSQYIQRKLKILKYNMK